MVRLITNYILLQFCARHGNSLLELLMAADSWAIDRRSRALEPGFPNDYPPEAPPSQPVRPIPTDVPVPEPHDVPVPDPGKLPEPAKPLKRPSEPKPRPIP